MIGITKNFSSPRSKYAYNSETFLQLLVSLVQFSFMSHIFDNRVSIKIGSRWIYKLMSNNKVMYFD